MAWETRSIVTLLCAVVSTHASTYKAAPYHVQFCRDLKGACFQQRDLHLLTGSWQSDLGGLFQVHVHNGIVPDYALHIGPCYRLDYALLNATLKCNGEVVLLTGHAILDEYSEFEALNFDSHQARLLPLCVVISICNRQRGAHANGSVLCSLIRVITVLAGRSINRCCVGPGG